MALRPATADDWAAMFGMQEPADWFGLVEARPHLVEGLGCIYRDASGRWWISFKRCPGVGKTKTAHASAKRLLDMARERGITVHGIADPEIDGGEKWLERLGFRRTDDELGGLRVWQTR